MSCGLSTSRRENIDTYLVDDKQHYQNQRNMMDNYMVIEIMNDIILQGLPMTSVTSEHALQTEQGHNVKKFSFKNIISKFKLDF